MGIETIKDHMVSLGFSVDKASYQETTKATADLETMLTKFASHAVYEFGKAALAVLGLEKAIKSVKFPRVPNETSSNSAGSSNTSAKNIVPSTLPLKDYAQKAILYFGEATAAVATFATAVTSATVGVIASLGNQEIKMEMLARSMWTTQTQAQAFSLSLKALGANLQDLYLSPTLLAQYQKLHAVALQMQTPSNYNQQISSIQNITLGFAQMQLEANYSLQWIGYYFTKYMAGPISQVQRFLASVNSAIVKQMPTWTKRVAAVMASFMQMGIYIVQALGNVWNWLVKMANYLPGWAKGIGAALGVLTLIWNTGPLGQFMTILSAAILLFDDFQTYIHGGKSALAPMWKELLKIGTASKSVDATSKSAKNMNSIFTGLGKTFVNIGHWFMGMMAQFNSDGTFSGLISSFVSLGNAIKGIALGIDAAFAAFFTSLTSSKNTSHLSQLGKFFTDLFGIIVNALSLAVDLISYILQGLVDIFTGKFSNLQKIGTNTWNAIKTIVLDALNAIGIALSPFAKNLDSVWTGVLSGAQYAWRGIETGFVNAINSIIANFDNLIKVIDLIPGVKIPLIPLVRFGGAVSAANSYIYPQTQSNTKSSTVHITLNNTIHGATDPNKTAAAIHHTFNKALHNVRGVIG